MNQELDSFGAVNRVRVLLITFGVLLALWIGCAKLVVPSVIESAYRGESLPVLNSLIKGQASHSVAEYIRDWEQFAWRSTVASTAFGLLGLVLVMVTTSPTFFRKFVGEATPGTLGAMRAWACGVCLVFALLEDLPSIAWLSAELREPQGVMGWLYALPLGLDRLVASAAGLHTFQLLTEFLLFLGMIGFGTRFVLPLAAICFFLFNGILRDYSFYWHQGWLPLVVITILSLSPSADGWSLDRLLRVLRGQPVPDSERALPVYGWSRYACWVAIAVSYFETGLGKLRDGGLFWWDPDGMRATFYEDTLMPREFDWSWSLSLTPVPDVLFGVFGAFAFAVELLWIIVPFSSTARKIWPVLTVIFHMGVLTLQRILFLDAILIQLVFYDLTGVRRAIARRLQNSYGRIQVLYDGQCPLCNRTVRVLRFFDLFARLEFLDFRRLDLAGYNLRHKLALTIQDLDREMYVISRGQPYIGYYGYRVLALALPALWPLSPLLFLPGMSWVGERVYGYIARNRLALVHCDSHCPSMPLGNSESRAISPVNDGPQPFRYAWLISGFCVVMAVSFFYRIEYYPLTAWHLYTDLNHTGKITYLKVFGRLPSGAIVPVRLEEAVGALGWDGRYRSRLNQCFESTFRDETGSGLRPDVDLCKKFVTISGVVYNKKSSPDKKITHFEIQQWVWDFRSNPSDPEHGKVKDRVIVEIEPVSTAVKKEI